MITIGCSVAAFQWDCRPISCLKHTSMHKHNLLGFLFQKNKSYLTWKAWTFFFLSCLITSSHPAEVNLVQMGVTILQNHYPRVMWSAVPNGWISIWWAVLTWITARIHIPAHPYFRLSRTPASAPIPWWVGWLKFQAPLSSRFSSVGRSSAAATLRLYFEWRLQWKHASTLPSYRDLIYLFCCQPHFDHNYLESIGQKLNLILNSRFQHANTGTKEIEVLKTQLGDCSCHKS